MGFVRFWIWLGRWLEYSGSIQQHDLSGWQHESDMGVANPDNRCGWHNYRAISSRFYDGWKWSYNTTKPFRNDRL